MFRPQGSDRARRRRLGVILAPSEAASALPLLMFAACPLSMVFMMRAMSGGRSCSTEWDGAHAKPEAAQSRDDELAALRAEIDQPRSERKVSRYAG